MSILHDREFAVVAVKSGELRLGLDLADEPFTNYLVPAKTLGAMPSYTHMIVLTNEQLSGNWRKYLHPSYKGFRKSNYTHFSLVNFWRAAASLSFSSCGNSG